MIVVFIAALGLMNDPNGVGEFKQQPRSAQRNDPQMAPLIPLPISNDRPELNSIFLDDGFSTKRQPPFFRQMMKSLDTITKQQDRAEALKDLCLLFDENGQLNPCAWHSGRDAFEQHFCIGLTNEIIYRRQCLVSATWGPRRNLTKLELTFVEPSLDADWCTVNSLSGLQINLDNFRLTKTWGKRLTIYIGRGFALSVEFVFSTEMRLRGLEARLSFYPTREHSYHVGYECVSGKWNSINRQRYDVLP